MSKRLESTSKFLSLILRHAPDTIGVELDAQGWVALDRLIAAANAHGVALTRDAVLDVVASSDKQRFALSADGARIRANQGHSVAVDLALATQTPPETLFHGTATRFVAAIRAQGLRPGQRQHVHLSRDAATASTVGARHGAPIVLVVRALAMHDDGHAFLLSDNGVWLTSQVPPSYLVFPPP